MCIVARCGNFEAKVKVNRPSWDDVYRLYNDWKKTNDKFQPRSLIHLDGHVGSLPVSNAGIVFNALINAPLWNWSKSKRRSPINDATVLKEWLSECDVWGNRDNEISVNNKNGLDAVRNMIGGRDGVCIVIRGDKNASDQAMLWGGESEDAVGADIHFDMGDTVYFWELIGITDVCENWIWSRGDMVFWMVGEYGDTKPEPYYSFKARSGARIKLRGEYIQNAKYQYLVNGGPTVKGDYKLNLEPDPNRIAESDGKELLRSNDGGIEQIPTGFVYVWGFERVRLEQVNVLQPAKDVNGVVCCDDNNKTCCRDLNSFYFHDSKNSGTSGCTEVESRFFKILKKYRNKMKKRGNKNIKIRVKVAYPENHVTRTKLDYEDD
jgi:hypothetical protein